MNESSSQIRTNIITPFLLYLDKCVQERHCPHYWVDSLNLFSELEEKDFAYFDMKLEKIKARPVDHIASEWLEWNRYACSSFFDGNPFIIIFSSFTMCPAFGVVV